MPKPAGALTLRCARRVVTAGETLAFTVESATGPLRRREVSLHFPGFQPDPASAADEFIWRGRLPRPGFHPLWFRTVADAPAATGADHFLATEPDPPAPRGSAGYYVFLGCGDYPLITGQETHPLASWNGAQWQELVAWMGAHGMNRLWVLLNGYTLAYPSARYPELRDKFARNVADNFLGHLIAAAHAAGVEVHLMLTTDGHGRDFSRLNPAAVRRDASGAPGAHHGLCLEHPAVQRYLHDVLDEVLTLYPQADGIAVHPTESDPERFNPESAAAFRRETGGDLATATVAERHHWHNATYARFLAGYFETARQRCPRLQFTMANCWWQDDHPEIYRAILPADVRIAVWHYVWEETAAKDWCLHRWLPHFGADRLIYVPTSQSYLFPADPGQVMTRHIGTDRLISTALAHGVRGTVYFAGWDILPEDARLRDVLLARHPTLGLVPAGTDPKSLIAGLYADYQAVRARLLAAQPAPPPSGSQHGRP